MLSPMETLRLIEIFASVQGESSLSGLPTTFVRLAACNLRCTWCDTTYSFGRGELHSLESILDTVEAKGCLYVCITGGEPLLQEGALRLMEALCAKGYKVSLETGGSLTIEKVDPRVKIILDIKCPGSRMEAKNLWSNLSLLKPQDEIKFVILDKEDYDYAKRVCEQYNLYGKEVLFSPVHDALDPKELVGWILRDSLRVRLNLQTHKYIWTPTTRGV